jgi:hypothetical protein
MPNSRGFYALPFTITNPTTTPFLQIATPTNAGARIMEFFISQEASETAAQEAITVQRRTTASTLPTAGTIVKLDPTDASTRLASSTTTNAYGIASATGTAGDLLLRFSFDSRVGLFYAPSDINVSIVMDVSQFLTFQFTATPAASVFSGHLLYEEI